MHYYELYGRVTGIMNCFAYDVYDYSTHSANILSFQKVKYLCFPEDIS